MTHHLDDLGTTVELDAPPSRVVSLVPNLSETLWWWHLADRVVGLTDHGTAPPRAFDRARRIRGTKNPDVAAIVELAPDLVVANEEENRSVDVERLRAAGLAVHVTRVRSVTDATHSLAHLATVLGVPAAGAALAQSIRRAIDQVAPPARRPRVLVPIWRDGAHRADHETWWLVGRDTLAGDLLRLAGFALWDAPGQDDRRYPRVRLAEAERAGLDAALLPDEPYAFGRDDHPPLRSIGVRIRHLDGSALTWWGPRTPAALRDLGALARQLARSPRGLARSSGSR